MPAPGPASAYAPTPSLFWRSEVRAILVREGKRQKMQGRKVKEGSTVTNVQKS